MAAAVENAGEKSKKKCRVCTDFKSWSKAQTAKKSDEPKECPPDGFELGRCSWLLLHSVAAYYPDSPSVQQQRETEEFLHLFSKVYPCQECAEHMQKSLRRRPPNTVNRVAFSQWMCQMHNEVNVRLGKSVFDCSKVDERWLDGWKDGSCD